MLISCKITANGTILAESVGKEDPVSLALAQVFSNTKLVIFIQYLIRYISPLKKFKEGKQIVPDLNLVAV